MLMGCQTSIFPPKDIHHDQAFIQYNKKNTKQKRNQNSQKFTKNGNQQQRPLQPPPPPPTSNTRQYREIRPKLKNGEHNDYLSFKMEAVLLENQLDPIPRCSSPTESYCPHCSHEHNRSCCLYYSDEPEDGPMYSQWKKELEYPRKKVKPYHVPHIPEAIAGGTTPKGFPSFSYNNPEFIATRITNVKTVGIPNIWFRQFYYPLVTMDIIQPVPPQQPQNNAPYNQQVQKIHTGRPILGQNHQQQFFNQQPIQQQPQRQIEPPLPYPLCCNAHYLLSQQQHLMPTNTIQMQQPQYIQPQTQYIYTQLQPTHPTIPTQTVNYVNPFPPQQQIQTRQFYYFN